MTINWEPKPGYAVMLRTCSPNMAAWNGFVWPREGDVIAPDWDPRPVVGGGLHGLLWGHGAGELLSWLEDSVWMLVEIHCEEIVDLIGKIKVPRGRVIYTGAQRPAIDFLKRHAPMGHDPVFASARAGAEENAIAGWRGKAVAGARGAAVTGWRGMSFTGRRGTATVGDLGEAHVGAGGVAVCGWKGLACAGHHGVANAGDYGRAQVGDYGVATAGFHGEAHSGSFGTSVVRSGGTASSGPGGLLVIGGIAGLVGRDLDLAPHVVYEVEQEQFRPTGLVHDHDQFERHLKHEEI